MNQKSKQFIFRILTAIFGLAFIILLLVIFKQLLAGKKAKQEYESLASMVNDTSSMNSGSEEESTSESETEPKVDELAERGITVPLKNTDWNVMKQMNEDIYAWIYVPNTDVDYPVLQHPSDDAYYLDHNLDGSGPRPACVFSKIITKKDFSLYNTTLYGHNINGGAYDGTMFTTLHNYEKEDFFNNEENRYIYVYQEGGKPLVYEVFAAVEFTDEVVDFRYSFKNEEERMRYINELRATSGKKSHVRKDMTITENDHFLTLSTCVASTKTKKYLVVSVLVNPSALKTQ